MVVPCPQEREMSRALVVWMSVLALVGCEASDASSPDTGGAPADTQAGDAQAGGDTVAAVAGLEVPTRGSALFGPGYRPLET